jgi:hypothetical protein
LATVEQAAHPTPIFEGAEFSHQNSNRLRFNRLQMISKAGIRAALLTRDIKIVSSNAFKI